MLASNSKASKDECITENHKKKKEEATAQSQSPHTPHESAPSTSSAACSCPSEMSGPLIMSNSVATQYSNSSFYDFTLLTPPDLPSDVEDEVLLAYNPNEPRYCFCNQISYGSMIACDNEKCPYEWFHFSCVGVKIPPKGKWYCPICRASRSRKSDARRGRKRKIPY